VGPITVSEQIPSLPVAVRPAIQVFGMGTPSLGMTTRLARVIERSRLLHRQLRDNPSLERSFVFAQMRPLTEQARLLQGGVILASVSILLAALLVITLCLTAVVDGDDARRFEVLCIACMLCLIGALVLFTRDQNRSPIALQMEIRQIEPPAWFAAHRCPMST